SGEEVDNSLLEIPVDVVVEWASDGQTYDVRARKDLGTARTVEATLDPWAPLIYTRCQRPLPAHQLECPAEVKAGASLEVTLRASGPLPEGTVRAVRLEIIAPGGQVYDLYSRNILVRSAIHREQVPLAHNDQKGRWLVQARDVM